MDSVPTRQIMQAFQGVPEWAGGPKYVPLFQMPVGTKLQVKAGPEFLLIINRWPNVFLFDYPGLPNGTTLKPTSQYLAPSSVLRANYFDKKGTHELVTAPIEQIVVVGAGIVLKAWSLEMRDEYDE